MIRSISDSGAVTSNDSKAVDLQKNNSKPALEVSKAARGVVKCEMKNDDVSIRAYTFSL